MSKPRYRCTHCGRNEFDARQLGCGEPEPRFTDVPYESGVVRERVTACPMDLVSPIRRTLFNLFGVLPQ